MLQYVGKDFFFFCFFIIQFFDFQDLLYKDTARWSFPFQMYADLTRLRVHQSNKNLKVNLKNFLYSLILVFLGWRREIDGTIVVQRTLLFRGKCLSQVWPFSFLFLLKKISDFFSGNIGKPDYTVLNEYFQWMTENLQEILHVDLIGKNFYYVLFEYY